MNSQATPAFWKSYRALPKQIRLHARRAYQLWRDNPSHPALRFKRISDAQPIYSVRINGLGYRAAGRLEDDTMVWQFVGKHNEYERWLNL